MLTQVPPAPVGPTQTIPAVPSRVWAVRFNVVLAMVVWLAWAVVGGHRAFANVAHYWAVSLTMVLGSLVGGGTSEGGAAIAFPVFTKVFRIPPGDARLFSFAIQTVGMGAASLSILYQRIPIEKRALAWAGTGGIAGMLVSTYLLVPRIPPVLVRVFFTAMVTSLALVLLLARRDDTSRSPVMPRFGSREKSLLVLAGILGGALSGLLGCGENIVVFMVMVVLFRVNEKVVTPTTVILMWMVTTTAFLLHLLVLRDMPARVLDYWLAAVPVVVVGAPLGAFLCTRIDRRAIVAILIGLISLELVSTIFLVDLRHGVGLVGLATLLLFAGLNWLMSRSQRYVSGISQRLPD